MLEPPFEDPMMLRPFCLATALAFTLVSGPVRTEARVKDEPMDSPHQLADDLVLQTMDGKPFSLKELRGHRVLLITWASW